MHEFINILSIAVNSLISEYTTFLVGGVQNMRQNDNWLLKQKPECCEWRSNDPTTATVSQVFIFTVNMTNIYFLYYMRPIKFSFADPEISGSLSQFGCCLLTIRTRGARGSTFFGLAGPGRSRKRPRPGPLGPLI